MSHSTRPLAPGLLALLHIACSSPAPEVEVDSSSPLMKVGDERAVTIASPVIDGAPGDEDLAWRIELSHAGASYICPHFSRFELPPGAVLVLSSPDGHQRHEYTGRGKLFDGVDRLGFWTAHIIGDTAIVELIAKGPVSAGAVHIDRFAHGFAELSASRAAAERSVCNADDSRWARCYRESEPVVYDKSRAVARLLINGSSGCTGWLVGDEGHLLTNQHCIESASVAANTNFEFMAEGESCHTDCSSFGACSGVVEADGAELIAADRPRDFALVQLPTNLSATYGYFRLRESGPVIGERIYIPQHPAVWGKKIALLDGDGPPWSRASRNHP